MKEDKIKWFSPIYMLTKLRSFKHPELGYKDRIIFNNSAKIGGNLSINDGVLQRNRSLRYPSAIEAIKYHNNKIKNVNKSVEMWMGKGDLYCGFENLWIPIQERPLLGINIEGMTMVSIVGEYGEAAKPKQMHELLVCAIFIVEKILKKEYKVNIPINESTIKYMDDFGVFRDNKKEVNEMLKWITLILWKHLGLKLKGSKTVFATLEMEFLGIKIFGQKTPTAVAISEDRKAKLKQRGNYIIKRRAVKFIQYHRFQGCAMSSSEIHWPLKAMLRGLSIWLAKKLHTEKVGYYDMVKREPLIINTIRAFLKAIEKVKAVQLQNILDYKHTYKLESSEYDIIIQTDASTEAAGGICLTTGEWFYHKWEKKISHRWIAWGEIIAVLIAIEVNIEHLKGKRVNIFMDNEPARYGLINKRYKNIYVDKVIKEICILCVHNNIFIRWDYINTKDNIYADYLSRLKIDKFKQQANRNKLIIKEEPQQVNANIYKTFLYKE